MPKESFSRRHGFHEDDPPITIWEDAPASFRTAVLQIAKEDCGLSSQRLLEIVCRELHKEPQGNWGESYIWGEVQNLVKRCEWHKVYNIIERIAEDLRGFHGYHKQTHSSALAAYHHELNQVMAELGIGWKLEGGMITARGEQSYEEYLNQAEKNLKQVEKPTALTELKEAIRDLSRLPSPDTSGAIQHGMAALECVARDVSNDPKPTLGQLIKKHPDLFPKPIDSAIEKLWGYASENARHGREGNDPTREEAMLVVGISTTLVNYLIHVIPE